MKKKQMKFQTGMLLLTKSGKFYIFCHLIGF